MTAPRTYRDLDAWKMAMRLAKETYRVTDLLPESEQYVLVQQMRRAGVSVASNIAEGNARRTRQAYIHHLNIAIGSLAELETQILLSIDLSIVSPSHAESALELAKQTGRLLLALVHALEMRPVAS